MDSKKGLIGGEGKEIEVLDLVRLGVGSKGGEKGEGEEAKTKGS